MATRTPASPASARRTSLSGSETTGLKQMRQQAPDLAAFDLAEHLVAVDAGLRAAPPARCPRRRRRGAVLGVLDVARARELVALLAVLAAALAVALAGDRRVAAARRPIRPDASTMLIAPRHVLHAVAVVLDAAGVHEEARLRRAPPLGRLPDRSSAMPVTSAVVRGVHSATSRRRPSKPTVWSRDERVVEPVVLDHQVQDAGEEGGVAARLDGQEQVAGAGERRDARIDDDDLRAVLAGLPDVVGRDRGALGDVRAADPDHLGLEDVAPGIGGPVDAERLLVRRPPRCTMHSRPL